MSEIESSIFNHMVQMVKSAPSIIKLNAYSSKDGLKTWIFCTVCDRVYNDLKNDDDIAEHIKIHLGLSINE